MNIGALKAEAGVGNKKIMIKQGDITAENVDAIGKNNFNYLVCPINTNFSQGSGVSGSIGKKAGSAYTEEVRKLLSASDAQSFFSKIISVALGKAEESSAGTLTNVKLIIHTFGPVWKGVQIWLIKGNEGEKRDLKSCIYNSIKKAHCNSLRTLAIPGISTGQFGYPKKLCAKILVKGVIKFLEDNPESSLKEVSFVDINNDMVSVFPLSR